MDKGFKDLKANQREVIQVTHSVGTNQIKSCKIAILEQYRKDPTSLRNHYFVWWDVNRSVCDMIKNLPDELKEKILIPMVGLSEEDWRFLTEESEGQKLVLNLARLRLQHHSSLHLGGYAFPGSEFIIRIEDEVDQIIEFFSGMFDRNNAAVDVLFRENAGQVWELELRNNYIYSSIGSNQGYVSFLKRVMDIIQRELLGAIDQDDQIRTAITSVDTIVLFDAYQNTKDYEEKMKGGYASFKRLYHILNGVSPREMGLDRLGNIENPYFIQPSRYQLFATSGFHSIGQFHADLANFVKNTMLSPDDIARQGDDMLPNIMGAVTAKLGEEESTKGRVSLVKVRKLEYPRKDYEAAAPHGAVRDESKALLERKNGNIQVKPFINSDLKQVLQFDRKAGNLLSQRSIPPDGKDIHGYIASTRDFLSRVVPLYEDGLHHQKPQELMQVESRVRNEFGQQCHEVVSTGPVRILEFASELKSALNTSLPDSSARQQLARYIKDIADIDDVKNEILSTLDIIEGLLEQYRNAGSGLGTFLNNLIPGNSSKSRQNIVKEITEEKARVENLLSRYCKKVVLSVYVNDLPGLFSRLHAYAGDKVDQLKSIVSRLQAVQKQADDGEKQIIEVIEKRAHAQSKTSDSILLTDERYPERYRECILNSGLGPRDIWKEACEHLKIRGLEDILALSAEEIFAGMVNAAGNRLNFAAFSSVDIRQKLRERADKLGLGEQGVTHFLKNFIQGNSHHFKTRKRSLKELSRRKFGETVGSSSTTWRFISAPDSLRPYLDKVTGDTPVSFDGNSSAFTLWEVMAPVSIEDFGFLRKAYEVYRKDPNPVRYCCSPKELDLPEIYDDNGNANVKSPDSGDFGKANPDTPSSGIDFKLPDDRKKREDQLSLLEPSLLVHFMKVVGAVEKRVEQGKDKVVVSTPVYPIVCNGEEELVELISQNPDVRSCCEDLVIKKEEEIFRYGDSEIIKNRLDTTPSSLGTRESFEFVRVFEDRYFSRVDPGNIPGNGKAQKVSI